MALKSKYHGAMFGDDSGFYTKNNIVHRDVYAKILPAALHIVDEVFFQGGTFVICDYGASDGGMSLEMFNQCIGLLKAKYGKDQPIHVVYEDLPTNDFHALFKLVMNGSQSYVTQYPDVYVSAVGRSFYGQCLPDNSVHFGFSSTAFHWLSETPCDLKRGIYFTPDEADEDENNMFSQQAAKDWSTNLSHRARELAPGGQMLINHLGKDPLGRSTGGGNFEKIINAFWRELLVDGIITQDEFLATNLRTNHNCSEEDLLAPLKDKGSGVYQAGLRLVSIQWTCTKDPFKTNWLAKNEKGSSVREHAMAYVRAIKSWSYNTLLEGLAENRSENDKVGIINSFYNRYEDHVAARPEDHEMEYVHARIHVRKVEINQV